MGGDKELESQPRSGYIMNSAQQCHIEKDPFPLKAELASVEKL